MTAEANTGKSTVKKQNRPRFFFPWREWGAALTAAVALTANPAAANPYEGHSPAVSVTDPVADFTEEDMQTDPDDDNLYTSLVVLEAGGGTGGPYLVKVTVDFADERDGYRLPACPFSRAGYTFAGWDAYDGCTYIEGEDWYTYQQDGVSIGGAHTGTFQPGFLYLTCGYTVFRAKWSTPGIPSEWKKARKLNGLYGEACGGGLEGAEGTVQLKCGKANKRGIAKISMTITPFNGKRRTYPSVSVDVSRGGDIEVRWQKKKYAVTINGDDFFGEPIYGEMRPACSPNAVWSANVGGSFKKTAWFDFGQIPENERVPVISWMFEETDATIKMNGSRWTLPKKASVTRLRCPQGAVCGIAWKIDSSRGRTNLPGLRLSYQPKTGIFKGSFSIYPFMGKKHTAKVVGVMVDGEGYGQALCKGLSSSPWIVTIF